MKRTLKEITKYLPDGWEAAARTTGALLRARNIATPEQLLSLLMTQLSGKGSLMDTAVQMRLAGISVNKNAAAWRVLQSGEWLKWMAERLSKAACGCLEKPVFLGDKRVILVDASDELVKNRIQEGKARKLWRLHYSFNLFDFCAEQMMLTDTKEGEKLTRYNAKQGDIFVADRVYCTLKGIEHLKGNGADFVLRHRSKSFTLYDKDGKKIDLLSVLANLQALESRSIECYYKNQEQQYKPIRIVAMKKDAKAIAETQKRMRRKWSKKQEPESLAETKEFNEYVVLATNLDYTNEQVLELYRARWQIEMLFFRLKSLFGYGNAPITKDKSAKAWFYGKLFLAALCEYILKQETFSPEAQNLISFIDKS